MAEHTESIQKSTVFAAESQATKWATFAAGRYVLPTWLDKTFGILSPLWVAGVAVVILGISLLPAAFFLSRGSRLGIWIPYLALGILFPAVMVLVLNWLRSGHLLPVLAQRILIVLALAAPLAVAQAVDVLPALGLALVQTAVCIGILKSRSTPLAVALMSVGFGSWLVMLKLFAWGPMPSVYPASWHLLAIGVASLIGCCWWAFRLGPGHDRFYKAADILALGLLILLAFRTDGLFQTDRVAPTGSFYHWGAAVGPAEAIRQGGVLLWDTPSPYGFLLPLTIAAFPASTTWQSLYVLNAISTALLAIGIYLAIRLRVPNMIGALLSLMLSAATVYLSSMYPPLLLPEHYYPMAGAFRYAWCYLLIGVLILERIAARNSRSRDWILVAGSICWLLSTLWSPESAFFGTLIWIPAYVWIVLRERHVGAQSKRAVAGWLLLPVALFSLSVGCLFAVYQMRFGHGPDVQAYFEVVLSFGGSQVAQTSGLFGPTDFANTALVLVFGVVLFAFAAAMLVIFNSWRDVPLAVGLMFGTWGLLAYPLSQPFLFASYRLLPFVVLGMAIILTLTVRPGISQRSDWTALLRMMFVPLLATILVTAYANLPELAYFAGAMRNEPFRGRDVTTGLPHVEESLQQLLTAAHVRSTDRLWYEGTTYGELLPVWQPAGQPPVVVSMQWLAGPLSSMIYLSDDRKQTYLARSAERQNDGGWLIEPRDRGRLKFFLGAWFFEQVNRTHIPTQFASNEDWQLIWFEPRPNGAGPEDSLQDIAWEPGLTDDVRINGEKLSSSVLPPVWGVWGSEWTSSAPERSGRCVAGEGTFFVYSSKARRVALKLKQPEEAPRSLTVQVNDELRGVSEWQGAEADTVSVSLQEGWNTIGISLSGPGKADGTRPVNPETCLSGTLPEDVVRIDRIDIRTK